LTALAAHFPNGAKYVTILAVFFQTCRFVAVFLSRCELFASRERENRSAMWTFRDILEICNRRAPLQLTKLVKSTRNEAPLGNFSALAARFANRAKYVTIAAVFFQTHQPVAVSRSRCELFVLGQGAEKSTLSGF
jgi:hypothetical protein